MNTTLSVKKFSEIIQSSCKRDTSADQDGWNHKNPLWGHCAVASLVAQNMFGGKLLRASLEGTPFSAMRSHYMNQLPDGSTHDFTKEQFGTEYPQNLEWEVRPRSKVLEYHPTKARYKELAFRFAQIASDNNPLFEDEVYKRCFLKALDSGCQKMWFGCIIVRDGKIIHESCNAPIEALRSLCKTQCIRFKITSRTESMLGACAHAEEGLWEVIHRGIPISECSLYIAGVYANGLPWIKKLTEHTCLRCTVLMHNAKVRRVYVPVANRWEGMSTEEALETARLYATQEKKV